MANQSRKPQKMGKKPSPFYTKSGNMEKKKKFGKTQKKWQIEDNEIKQLREQYDEIDSTKVTAFDDLPLSSKTKKGLKDAKYAAPTEIQRESIGLALQGHDILGAAKTGSGKTIAFLVPVLECLYRVKWNPMDGLGALIISPTRELAYQIFEVLKKIGKYHDFSAGLVIGGKHLKEEAERIGRTNIVICTPGRMLQHMDETPYFSADNLHILVLDEADRCLDLGFQQTMNAIIANLPPKRQTLLFSATQTKSVKDLARLSLKEPMYVSVHENAKHSTPQQLEQSYIVFDLHQKLDFLWSFLKNHLKQKILVFISSCKQVRFIYEAYKKMRVGMTVLCLHGAMKQLQRVAVYDAFCRKENAILFATDIAARGLDFPNVNWVIQLDCPEDANTYIHRVGRTARYSQDGEALLVLLPSEQDGMLEQLQEKRIPINQIKVNPRKLWSIQGKLQSMLAAEVQLKEFAQRAFVNYIKSVYLMRNKKVFDVQKLDTDQYARSLGLAIPPRIRFLQKAQKRREDSLQKSSKFQEQQPTCDSRTAELLERLGVHVDRSKSLPSAGDSSDEDSSTVDSEQESGSEESDSLESKESDGDSEGESSEERTKRSAEESTSSPDGSAGFNFALGEEDIDDILTVKKVGVTLSDGEQGEENTGEGKATEILSNKARKRNLESTEKRQEKLAKKLLRKNLQINTKVTFDEDSEEEGQTSPQRPQSMDRGKVDSEIGGLDIEMAQKRMREADKHDKELYRQKIRQRHREKKMKEKELRRKQHQQDEEDEPVAVLGSNEENTSDDDHLPDPDKIYGPEKNSDQGSSESQSDTNSDDDSSEEESEEDDDKGRPPRKKLRTAVPTIGSEYQEPSISEEESSSDSSSGEESSEEYEDENYKKQDKIPRKTLKTDEAIALKLLGL